MMWRGRAPFLPTLSTKEPLNNSHVIALQGQMRMIALFVNGGATKVVVELRCRGASVGKLGSKRRIWQQFEGTVAFRVACFVATKSEGNHPSLRAA